MDKPYDILKIMEFLPHRYPFLLLDRVIDLVPGESIVALKNVTISEPFFQGHFPKEPIMPGVLMVEAMAQAGGVLAYETVGGKLETSAMYFMGMDKVKFRKPVIPGDQLIFDVKIIRNRSTVFKMAGTAKVDGKIVTEAELMASLGEK
ncbi:MAG TPA: 3-hydroxyacyl-[acyl-carrier-protein] dehydratase FabZ [Desulfobacteraceae bacterium]|nr:3-hydroxyacyl-[acyl-carrier-protein] dehydratase FabZ [Desulfobacteraceae bacterium]